MIRLNNKPHAVRLEEEILKVEHQFLKAPDETRLRNRISEYLSTLKTNYHVITGRRWTERGYLGEQ